MWLVTALFCLLGWDESESFHKKASPLIGALGLTRWRNVPLQIRPVFLICWLSSVCCVCPGPSEASVKSPLQRTTGLDSYKLEQSNLSVTLTPTPAPRPRAASRRGSGRRCEHCCGAQSSSCLVMRAIVMRVDSIRKHFWLPTVFPCLSSAPYVFMPKPSCHDKADSMIVSTATVGTVHVFIVLLCVVLHIQELLRSDPYLLHFMLKPLRAFVLYIRPDICDTREAKTNSNLL